MFKVNIVIFLKCLLALDRYGQISIKVHVDLIGVQ